MIPPFYLHKNSRTPRGDRAQDYDAFPLHVTGVHRAKEDGEIAAQTLDCLLFIDTSDRRSDVRAKLITLDTGCVKKRTICMGQTTDAFTD